MVRGIPAARNDGRGRRSAPIRSSRKSGNPPSSTAPRSAPSTPPFRPWTATARNGLRITVALDLTFKRHNATVQLRMERGDEETADGAVVAVFMRQYQEQEKKLDLAGALEDGRMHVQIDGGRIDRRLRWGDDVVGVYRLEHFFQDHKPKPGDHFSFPVYQPTLNAVVPTQVLVKDAEDVPLGGGRGGATPPLLRVEIRPDKIEGSGRQRAAAAGSLVARRRLHAGATANRAGRPRLGDPDADHAGRGEDGRRPSCPTSIRKTSFRSTAPSPGRTPRDPPFTASRCATIPSRKRRSPTTAIRKS